MANPAGDNVDSSGFDNFIGIRKKGQKAVASWPTGKEFTSGMKKTASAATADITRTNGQFFDPAYFDPLLFWIQHRDRKELNFRLRHAYEYEPIIGNVIDLHRQMPLSGYNLVCKDPSIKREMEDMADKWELLTTSSYILGDYILLGEACMFKVWDDYNKTWKELTLLPPEKVELRKTYLSKQPLAMLHVDSELKRLVNSGDPVDQEIVKNMDPDLVDKIRTSERIYLPNHQFEHFAYKTSEYDLRGTSIVKRALYALLLKYKVRILHSTYLDRGAFPLKIFKLGSESQKWIPNRAHFDGLRNALDALANDPSGCFSADTELLTREGWKTYDKMAIGEEFATLNPESGEMEYRPSTAFTVYDHDGEMIHFKSRRMDMLVTPNHNVWAQPVEDRLRNGTPCSYPWRFKHAEDMTGSYRFRATPDSWTGTYESKDQSALTIEDRPVYESSAGNVLVQTKTIKSVRVGSQTIELDDFLALVGFYLSEGCIWNAKGYVTKPWRMQITQNCGDSELNLWMQRIVDKKEIEISTSVIKNGSKLSTVSHRNVWGIYSQEIVEAFRDQFGVGSFNKKIPTWVKSLPPQHLKVLLRAMILGDGTIHSKCGVESFTYYSSSKRLADDVQEIALKIGWYAHLSELLPSKKNKLTKPHYHVPIIPNYGRQNKHGFSVRKNHIKRVQYKGKVFCPTVPPHHLVFCRRNGKVLVSGQSLIYHFGLNVEVIGTKDKWENLIPHYQWCDSEMLKALFASDAVVDSKGTTFSNSNTALRVLMSRYQMLRDQLEHFWRHKIFRMVAEARGYWVSDSTGSMGNVPTMERNGKFLYLDIPRFKWSKLNLLDDVAQKQFLMRLRERLELPHETIASIFDLDPQELKDKLKSEESSIVDPVAIEVRKKASQQPAVMSQILQGDKSKEWVLDTSTPVDEGKKDKARKDVAGPAPGSPDLGQPKPPGQGQPGMPPPGGQPTMPKPPGAGGPGMGQPPLSPSPEPGKGPVSESPL